MRRGINALLEVKTQPAIVLFLCIVSSHTEELYHHPESESGHGGGWKGLVPFSYVTKCIAIKTVRGKDFSSILGENLLTLMTQILRETARKNGVITVIQDI